MLYAKRLARDSSNYELRKYDDDEINSNVCSFFTLSPSLSFFPLSLVVVFGRCA